MKVPIVLLVVGALAILIGHPLSLRAQPQASPGPGVYTKEQSRRGEVLYDQTCAECHGVSMLGTGQAPPLVGAEFVANWKDLTLGDLLERIQVSMPAGDPGRMTRQQKADILAYILSANQFPSGGTELPNEIQPLKDIPFRASSIGPH